MTVDRGADRQKIRSDSEWLLLVEGKDEVNVFDVLIKHCHIDRSKIQIIQVGKESFSNSLKALHTELQSRPPLRSIGIVRDADDNADNAFKSVRDHLRKFGYKPPPGHGQFSDAVPSIGVFIVPDGVEPGAIETLCRRSRENNDVAKCVEEYLSCLDEHKAMKSMNVDKSFAHAYLAAMRDPVARVGEGAQQGAWDFGSPAFAKLSEFLNELTLRGC